MKRLWGVWVGMLMVSACGQIAERKQPPPSLYQLSQSDLDLSGEQLARGYCASCHVMPEPEVLGLLALMLLNDSRQQARSTPDGVWMARVTSSTPSAHP